MKSQERGTREQLEQQQREREGVQRERDSITAVLDAAQNKGRKLEEVSKNIPSPINCWTVLNFNNTQVGDRQKRRKMAQLKSYTKCALQPMESYGLIPQTVHAVTEQGQEVSFKLSEDKSLSPSASAVTESSEENTRSVLFLLDRFGVSDEFYHELSQVHTFPTQDILLSLFIKEAGIIIMVDTPSLTNIHIYHIHRL